MSTFGGAAGAARRAADGDRGTRKSMPNPAIQELLARQTADGGFGAYAGGESRTEATALGSLALHLSREAEAAEPAEAAFRWLRSSQTASGAWPLAPGGPSPSWSTSLATLALSHRDPADPAAVAGARWLIAEEGQRGAWWVRLLFRLFPNRKAVLLDTDLVGWPWAEGTFSWVEPTAYAMLALRRMRGLDDGRRAERLDEGARMILDRACVAGGWNYGNTRVFGDDLWPYPDTTALALLALAGREAPEIDAALDALPPMLAQNGSVLAQSLGALALAAHGRDPSAARGRVAASLEARAAAEARVLAWAALSLVDSDDALGVRDG